MKQVTRIGRAAARALPPTIFSGVGFLAFGAFDMMRRGTPPIVMAAICLGLTAVVFATYFLLGIAGYRVSTHGAIRAPWPYALGRRPRRGTCGRRHCLRRASGAARELAVIHGA
jgi:hypothetical protein